MVAALRAQRQPTTRKQTANANVPTNSVTPAPQSANTNVEAQQQVPEQRVEDVQDTGRRDVVVRNDRRSMRWQRGRAVKSPRGPVTVGTVGMMDVVARASDEESVTPFVSLVASGAPLTSGQLVRVSVPRSALASLGLPVNPASSSDAVKADVLLGDDGLAHAIRFVR